jgi:hypothetical protein
MFPTNSRRQPFRNIENANSTTTTTGVPPANKKNQNDSSKLNRRLFDNSFKRQKLLAPLVPSSRQPFLNISNSVVAPTTRTARAVMPARSNYRVSTHKSLEKKTTPNEDFLNRIKKVVDRYPFGTGYLDIRAAIQEGDSEWCEEGFFSLDKVTFTEGQMRRIRVLIVSVERYAAMDEMGKLILGKEFHCRPKTFGPGFSYSVLRRYDTFKELYYYSKESTTPKCLFNMLFGFTYHLYRNPRWMTHHSRGWGGEKMVTGLTSQWKELMKHSTQTLGLDLEFSYPAVMYFLQDFKKKVERVETYGDPRLRFDYK